MKDLRLNRFEMKIRKENLRLAQSADVYIDRVQYIACALFILVILIWIYRCVHAPVSPEQQQQILIYSKQDMYPQTKRMLKNFLKQPEINQYQYFLFLRGLEREQGKIKFEVDAKD